MRKLFNNKIFKVLYNTFRFCFILMIVLYLSFVIVQRLSGNKSIMGYRLFNVATGSMTGVYNINDVIAVKDYDTKKLKVGDDIAYRGKRGGFEGLLVTHRIIKIEPLENGKLIFTTQGVNSNVADPKIEESQILGKVVGVVPVISNLNHVVKTQLGFFLLIFCPLVLVIVLEVLQTITDIKLEKNEIQKIEKDSHDKNNSKKEESNKKDLDKDKNEKKAADDEKKDNDNSSKSSKKENNKDEEQEDNEDKEVKDDSSENNEEEIKVEAKQEIKEEFNDDPQIVEIIDDNIEIL